jgi:hypothetical protein
MYIISYIWLRYGRKHWSLLINLFFWKERQPLPSVSDLADIASALKTITWRPDRFGDWIQDPELTWGTKRGDCEDFAALAVRLMGRIGIEGYLLSVILHPLKYSHAVCVFRQGDRWVYFSNAQLIETDCQSDKDIVKIVANDHNIVCWSLENDKGEIIKCRGTACRA